MVMNDCFALNGSSPIAEKVRFKLPSATVTVLPIDRMGTVEQDSEIYFCGYIISIRLLC
jgi:hypothetical protein